MVDEIGSLESPPATFSETPSIRIVAITGVVAFILAPLAYLILHFAVYLYISRDTTPRGVLFKPSEWPEPVQEMHGELVASGSNVDSFSVYLLYGRPAETLSTVVCRVKDLNKTWKALEAHLRLRPITADRASMWAGRQVLNHATSDWWAAAGDAGAEFFACEVLATTGGEGPQFVVARDIGRKTIFIHYSFNF